MSEQDPNNTDPNNTGQTDSEQTSTDQSGIQTGGGAAEQEEREQGERGQGERGQDERGQDERQGEQATNDEQPDDGQASTDEASADEASADEASADEASADEAGAGEETNTEEKPAEAEAPEDLFDLLGEEGKKHKKKKPEPAKTASNQSAGQQQKAEEKKYPAQAEIVYAGHHLTVPCEMTGSEIIDELLADDFPELTKESTEFTHDETRNRIVPTRKALKKGARGLRRESGGTHRPSPTADASSTGEPPSLKVHTRPLKRPLPPVHRVLAHDGVYEVRDTDLGTFTARLPGEAMMSEGGALKVPRAPVSLLEKTIAIFKGRPEREALLTIVYDHGQKAHRLVWADQTTSRSRVHYDAITEDEYLTVYAEIHSHNSMEAFFSPVDDGSEVRSTGIYGVIGRIDLQKPQAAFRYSCGHHFRRTPAGSLFDDPARVAELLTEVPG